MLVPEITTALDCQDVLTAKQLNRINRYNWHCSCLTRLPVSLKLNYYNNFKSTVDAGFSWFNPFHLIHFSSWERKRVVLYLKTPPCGCCELFCSLWRINDPIRQANSAITGLLTASAHSSDRYDLLKREGLAVLYFLEKVLWDIQVCWDSASVAPDRYKSLQLWGCTSDHWLVIHKGIDELFTNKQSKSP